MTKRLNELNIAEIAKGFSEKKFSSVEVTKDCLNSIKAQDKDLNAFITVTEDLALKRAKESDARRAKGETLSKLDGVPIAIKDNMAVKDFPTTAGSKMLEDFVSSYDAFVVQKLKEAGAVIIGKTNMDEFAMGSSTESSYFGPTKNPHDLSRVPGGSSGGSAAAVSSDEAICALGSDTGGSIRQPASFCGVVGFKPTYGAVSRNGLFAMASSLDQIGPITKTVGDAEILFDIISGYDRKDSTSFKDTHKDIKKKNKIGYFSGAVGTEVDGAVEKIAADLNAERLDHDFIKYLEYALAVYYILMPVEASSNLGRYDGIKYGYSVEKEKDIEIKNLIDVYTKSRAKGFGPEVKRRIMLGAFASAEGHKDQYYEKAQKVRAFIIGKLEEVFSKYDFVICPTTPDTAFFLDSHKDPLSMYLEDMFTIPANIAGIPAISIPVGKDKDGLPIGVQIMGPKFSDKEIFELAKKVEAENG